MWGLSYWTLPLISSFVWLAMLLAMLLWWTTKGSPHLAAMAPSQHIAYISDIGATSLKPLFIAMSAVTVVIFDLGFIAERWLRHRGRLARNTTTGEKIFSSLAIIASIVGAAGLILLACFDTLHHHTLHDTFLGVFIAGYVVSAIFICWEYWRLGVHFRRYKVLRFSFWMKLFFILIEVALAIAFGVTQRLKHYNVSAILEWIIALIYFFYVLSFFIDFIPAVHTKHHQSKTTEEEMATAEAVNSHGQRPMTDDRYHDRYENPANGYGNGAVAGHQYAQPLHGNGYAAAPANGYANGYANGHTNGYANGYPKPENGVLRAGQHY